MATPTFTKVTPHIHKLDLPFLGGRMMVGVFLVQEADGWVLVDAGAPGFDQAIFTQGLAPAGGRLPKKLPLTHGQAHPAAAAQHPGRGTNVPGPAHPDEEPCATGPRGRTHVPTRSRAY